MIVRWNCVEMNDDDDDSKIEIYQNFNDSDVFTKDKRVNVDIETIWVFFMNWLSSESFMQSHGSVKSFTLIKKYNKILCSVLLLHFLKIDSTSS